MVPTEDETAGRAGRRRRSIAEKRRIVQLTLEPGASVAAVARYHGVNANQVLAWRRLLERGGLVEPRASSTALIPVSVSGSCEPADETSAAQPQAASGGAIHIELPGRAMISVESGADPELLRFVLESLRK